MLIDRDTGLLTAAGARYQESLERALDTLGATTLAVTRAATSRLEIWCVPGFASLWLNPSLADFRRAHPKIAVDLRPSETGPSIAHHQADADIRFVRDEVGRPPGPDIRAIPLTRPAFFPVASPELARTLSPRLAGLEDLLTAPLLHEEDDADWRAWLKVQGTSSRLPPPVARLWQAHLALGAAREGQGLALTNSFLAREDLRAGRLVPVTLASGAPLRASIGVYMLSARADRWDTLALSRFRQWLVEACADQGEAGA